MKTAKKYMALIAVALFALLAIAVFAAATVPANAETQAEEQAIVMVTDDQTAPAAETAEDSADNSVSGKAIAAGVAIGLAALGGAIGMGIAIAKASEGISRQPEATGNIRSSLMLGLVFIETVVIYALIVSILLIFVL